MTDLAPPALGASWLRLPHARIVAAIPKSWRIARGEGALLSLPYTQYVAAPPAEIEGLALQGGVSHAARRRRRAATAVTANANAAANSENIAEPPSVHSLVALVFTRYPGALHASVLRAMKRPPADVARFLTSFLVVRAGPERLVSPGLPDATPSAAEAALAIAGGGGGSGGIDSGGDDEANLSAGAPPVTVLASWGTRAPGAGDGGADVDIYGIEFALPVTVGSAAAASGAAVQSLPMRFNSTLLLDSGSGDVIEVTFRCPEELWEVAWEGGAPVHKRIASERRRRGTAAASETNSSRSGGAAGADLPPLLRGFDVLGAKAMLDMATLQPSASALDDKGPAGGSAPSRDAAASGAAMTGEFDDASSSRSGETEQRGRLDPRRRRRMHAQSPLK